MKQSKKEKPCCNNPTIEEGREKYPLGLALDSIYITYCSNCGTIIDVRW
jgi:hypothetical protein